MFNQFDMRYLQKTSWKMKFLKTTSNIQVPFYAKFFVCKTKAFFFCRKFETEKDQTKLTAGFGFWCSWNSV